MSTVPDERDQMSLPHPSLDPIAAMEAKLLEQIRVRDRVIESQERQIRLLIQQRDTLRARLDGEDVS